MLSKDRNNNIIQYKSGVKFVTDCAHLFWTILPLSSVIFSALLFLVTISPIYIVEQTYFIKYTQLAIRQNNPIKARWDLSPPFC